MLSYLYIANYAIIEELKVDFNDGFTVITGETGAGKSILLGALSLILGKRVDTSVLNDKSKKCVIEGVFKIIEEKHASFFSLNDLDIDNETTVRREISPTGKSRAFINDTPVNLTVLKEFSELLIDIHSQHQTLQVKDVDFQLNVVDSYAELSNKVILYKKEFKKYIALKRAYENLVNQEKTAKSDVDYLTFQLNELLALSLKENEQEELEAQLEIINNSEEIKEVLQFSVEAFNNSDNNIVSTIKSIQQSFSKLSHCSEDYKNISERLNSTFIEVADIAREIELLNDNSDFDTDNAEYINLRLNSIYSLEQKHHLSNSNELIHLQETLKDKLAKINSFDEEIENHLKELELKEKELRDIAKQLSAKRVKSFAKLSKEILTNLSELGMAEASFEVRQTLSDKLNEHGLDEITFLFSANKGFSPIELHKAASGGELSRLMLTIKSILSKTTDISTILFDEIDTGVSGDVADKMGSIMKQMSSSMQVIAITHLPQVAAKGNHHYKISKKITNDKTITTLSVLSKEDRINELAKMLSGKELTKAARENAKNLISN
ncbi:DNA repair protein RecN [Vicingus serpentipes]|uniref:DNA repair protein RecN n=1 Tax=Vicingus serpentipes TaxID=1926625 RepID=A0A5C6RUB7_9FLAO|nr:DNA repair protein RecN [Vicingus serpentipes]TXB65823.1 DNA repair protein RecN [Vicingus serpentipes]